MAFVKGHKFNSGIRPIEGYFNTDCFVGISAEQGVGRDFSVCGYIHISDCTLECVIIREGFQTKEEAEKWLATKAVQWGIVLADPNQ